MIECPCKDCKTRTAVCHGQGMCPSYDAYRIKIRQYNYNVKMMQKDAGFGIPWNQTKGNLYGRRGK